MVFRNHQFANISRPPISPPLAPGGVSFHHLFPDIDLYLPKYGYFLLCVHWSLNVLCVSVFLSLTPSTLLMLGVLFE